ncbi:MAG: class I SAM-dependent methyltransferase [Thermoprotei archaeon]
MSDSGEFDLYLKGEERFGRFSSYFYTHFAKRWLKQLHEFALREVVREALAIKPKRIVDIGSGPGWLTCTLAKRLPEVEVYGIDPSPHMIRHARTTAEKMDLNNIRFELGSSRHLPDMVFNLAYSVLSFHHWAEQKAGLTQIYEHLSGGRFMVFEYNRDRLPPYYFPARNHAMRIQTLEGLREQSPFPKLEIKTEGALLLAAYVKDAVEENTKADG